LPHAAILAEPQRETSLKTGHRTTTCGTRPHILTTTNLFTCQRARPTRFQGGTSHNTGVSPRVKRLGRAIFAPRGAARKTGSIAVKLKICSGRFGRAEPGPGRTARTSTLVSWCVDRRYNHDDAVCQKEGL